MYSIFLTSKDWFCWMYQYNKYMFNFIDIYIFNPVSGCVGRDHHALLCPGAYNAVKTALPNYTNYLLRTKRCNSTPTLVLAPSLQHSLMSEKQYISSTNLIGKLLNCNTFSTQVISLIQFLVQAKQIFLVFKHRLYWAFTRNVLECFAVKFIKI